MGNIHNQKNHLLFELSQIEKQYSDFFTTTEAEIPFRSPLKFSNFYLLEERNGKLIFKMLNTCGLPGELIKKCYDKFNECVDNY